jgi:hypothetical protein
MGLYCVRKFLDFATRNNYILICQKAIEASMYKIPYRIFLLVWPKNISVIYKSLMTVSPESQNFSGYLRRYSIV